MRILIVTTSYPFIKGGAEIHAQRLNVALQQAGHQVELFSLPFKDYPPQNILNTMLISRLLDVTEFASKRTDLVIGLKFPAYLIQHPNKVLWVLHQYREAYELWGNDQFTTLHHKSQGHAVKNAILNADNRAFAEARKLFANSGNVAKRMKIYNQVDATALYHPPQHAELFYCDLANTYSSYFLFPSRITPIKRQTLILEALALTSQPIYVKFVGTADNDAYMTELALKAHTLGVANRITWLGHVSEEAKRNLYAQALAVLYPPYDEDFGYVTLEAMLSSKAVLTCADSGGPLEFVLDNQTGLVAQPTAQDIARCMDALWANFTWAKMMGQQGREYLFQMDISWESTIRTLLA
ncbi:MAG: glycosyltransferase family 4 protein [Anaerolineae bacterium]|nr:glycosyltransferase family 4 protein [Anaerolineae bacterium]